MTITAADREFIRQVIRFPDEYDYPGLDRKLNSYDSELAAAERAKDPEWAAALKSEWAARRKKLKITKK